MRVKLMYVWLNDINDFFDHLSCTGPVIGLGGGKYGFFHVSL